MGPYLQLQAACFRWRFMMTELEGPLCEKAGGVSTVSGKTPPLANPLLHLNRPRVERSTRGRATKLE
jgi:hypothetical protein